VVVLVTGNGLKDVSGAMKAAAGAPVEVDPDIEAVEAILCD